jgi:hypothetical protein
VTRPSSRWQRQGLSSSAARWLLLLLPFVPMPGVADYAEAGGKTSPSSSAATQAVDHLTQARILDRDDATNRRSADSYYNAACHYALSGRRDLAFERLYSAIGKGLSGMAETEQDSDLASLHSDGRWSGVLARLRAADARRALVPMMGDQSLPPARRFFLANEAMRNDPDAFSDPGSVASQLFANLATFVGDYALADRLYLRPASRPDPVSAGYSQMYPAIPTLLPMTQVRRAVFLNESHGRPQTRAVDYAFLAPLRQQGFGYLALEGLHVSAPQGEGCGTSEIADIGLSRRGYPIEQTGYYVSEPIMAGIVREALRLGYRLVAYESSTTDAEDQGAREQAQADNLACVFAQDEDARLLVIAGFGHISEMANASGVAGGLMAHRFKAATGIDPLTIDTTQLLQADLAGPQTLSARPAGHQKPTPRGDQAYVLVNASGDLYGNSDAGYDVSLLVPSRPGRGAAGASWLDLGGVRRRLDVPDAGCRRHRPCLVDARPPGEPAASVPLDRCVMYDAKQTHCSLYLMAGDYAIRFLDAGLGLQSTRAERVRAPSAGKSRSSRD